ncbi:MAG: PRC-barrel domain-containing protein [Streptosporangiaceae bacterium]
MALVENLSDWRGHNVVDQDGNRIGRLEDIYVDTTTDKPSFAAVRVGMVGRHRITFVPLDGCSVAPSYLRVRHSRKTVKDAPTIEQESELPVELEAEIFRHYELPYSQVGAQGGRRLARR